MSINIEEIFQKFGPLNNNDFINLFLEPYKINEKYLLTLSLQKIIGSNKISECIFKKFPDFISVFLEENLNILLEPEFKWIHFSKKDILNLYVNFNNDLIDKVLNLNIFEKIYIIHDDEEYDSECLNIVSEGELSFLLLEKNDLKPQIFLKNLADSNGHVIIKYLDHLGKCISLFSNLNPSKSNFIFQSLDFMIKLDRESLKKIMKKFNLVKYLDQFTNEDVVLDREEIENLLFINNNIINSYMLQIILNSFVLRKDQVGNFEWVQKLFKENEICYSNYDLFSWIISVNHHRYCYENNYLNIEEIHRYTFPDLRTSYEFHYKNYFVEKLAEPYHVIRALEDILNNLDENDPHENTKALADMVEFILRKRSSPAFEELLNNSQFFLDKNPLFNLYKVKGKISQEFNDIELILNFKTNHNIKTTIGELLNTKNWDDLADFCDKIKKKQITIEEISHLKLPKIGEFLKEKNILKNLLQCCVCYEMLDDLYLFQECSHSICENCLENYMIITLKLEYTKKKDGNKFQFRFRQNGKSVLCPNCKKENVNGLEMILMKIFA